MELCERAGSAITSATRKEAWTPARVGNWGVHKNDVDAIGDYFSASERHFSSTTCNKANEYDTLTNVFDSEAYPNGADPESYKARGDFTSDTRLHR